MKTLEDKNLTWIEMKNPKNENLDWLKKNFELHQLVIDEIYSPLNYPKIEDFGDYLFIVLFFPFFNKETSQTIPFEIDIIVSGNYIITSHYKDIVPLKKIFDKCSLYEETRKEYFEEGSGNILYRIIYELLKACFPKLKHIKEKVDEIEQIIYHGNYQKATSKISFVKRDLIGFQRVMEPQKLTIAQLSKKSSKFFDSKYVPYFNSLVNLYSQVRNLIKTNRSSLKTLSYTNQSLLRNRTNNIIKTLTVVSVVIFPLTLITGLFGMSTNYQPLANAPYDFWIIIGIMAALIVIMVGYFKWRKWI